MDASGNCFDYEEERQIRASNALTRCFESDKKKFFGKPDQDLSKYKKDYERKCKSSGASEDKRKENIHVILGGLALEYYTDHLEDRNISYDEIFEALWKEFYANDELHELETELNNITLKGFKADSNTEKEALGDLYTRLKKIQSILGGDYKGDKMLRTQLVRACQGASFMTKITRIALHRPTYAWDTCKGMKMQIALDNQSKKNREKIT